MASTHQLALRQVLGKRPRGELQISLPNKKSRRGSDACTSTAPESTHSSSTEPYPEGSSHSRITTPEFESHGSDPGTPKSKQLNVRATPTPTRDGQNDSLDNLDFHIPLGSMTLRLSVGGCKHVPMNTWTESNDLWLAFHDYLVSRDAGPVAFARSLADTRWVRVLARRHETNEDFATIRVYVLPDDVGRRQVSRSNGHLRKALIKLIDELDTSLESWEGYHSPHDCTRNYRFESSNDDSLFYLFNTLPSPVSRPSPVSCPVSNEAINSVSESVKLPGLHTRLYAYQKRTAATMIKREVDPARALDPRLTVMQGPTGQVFYYDRDTGVLVRHQRVYDEARGGILGESMGLGKTLICLAVIVATKGHWPMVPPEYSLDLHPVRPKVGSLMEMAAAAVGRSQIPWRAIFSDLSHAGQDHNTCLASLEDNIGSYIIPAPVGRWSRRPSTVQQGKTVRLSTATLIIVPQNLLSQWRSEISEHVEENYLKLLCPDAAEGLPFPPTDQLLRYDIILMSRQRFEHEMVPSETARARLRVKAQTSGKGGCNCPLDDDCYCSASHGYHSPLRNLHFLRIIMDEGHEFSSSGRSGKTYWALQMLHVDRRWVVSGTPANGLLGVEVGTATYETYNSLENASKATNADVLQARRTESAKLQERKDLERLGLIVAGFLQVKPWSNGKDEDAASWQKYIMPYEDGRRKVRSLKILLESLVVRHRIADIEADIQLPTLHNRVVYLQPSWHDKLSINLFIMTLTANAVTSERVDEDYMFHPKNRRQLHILISNLRQSGFFWTSFSPESVAETVKFTRAYYEEHECLATDGQETDQKMIENILTFGDLVLDSPSWRCFAEMHEMGMFVEEFPADARTPWSLVSCQDSDPLLVGATQLAKAQAWVDSRLYLPDPSHGLAGAGATTMKKLRHDVQPSKDEVASDDSLTREGPAADSPPRNRPSSTHVRVPKLTQKQTISRVKVGSSLQKLKKIPDTQQPCDIPNASGSNILKPTLKSALKAPVNKVPVDLLPPDSPLAKTRLSGTASAKLSYLLDQISAFHQDEKILVFYEGDHIAWYIAQALDLIDVRYLIYTKSLTLERQNSYIKTFNTTESFRVLLMNVHQAAHGLHIASASRVFFVNPVWQPNVEAQAIKRAHRIGQTRPVYVETLVLKDTLEDQMLRRRRGMTAQEHQKAERSLLDDDTMSAIIKNAQFIPLHENEIHDTSKQVARLQTPQQLFGRPRKGERDFSDPDADLIFPTNSSGFKKTHKRERNTGQVNHFSSLIRFSAIDEANLSGASTQTHKNDSEYAADRDSPPPRRKTTPSVRFSTNVGADTPEPSGRMEESDAIDGPNLDTSSPPTRRQPSSFGPSGAGVASLVHSSTSKPIASSTPGGSGRRVEFNLTREGPRSLFGGDDAVL